MGAVPSSFAHHGRRLLLSDVVAVCLAPGLAIGLRGLEWDIHTALAFATYWALGAIFSMACLVQLRIGQILPHLLSRRDVTQILKMAAIASAFTAVTAFSVWRLELIPRSIPVLHFIVLAGLLAGWRSLAGAFERRNQGRSHPGHRVPRVAMLIVGVGPATSLLIRLLKSFSDMRPNIVGLLDEDVRLHGRSVDGHAVLGGLDRFEALVAELASHGVVVQRVLIAHLDLAAQTAARDALVGVCCDRGIELGAISERLGLVSFIDTEPNAPGDATLAIIKTRAQRYLSLRRFADAGLALAGLVVLSPVMGLVALSVRLRLGAPVTFWQQRVGLDGDQIVVHKFRTFAPSVDSEGRLLSDDDRATGLGRFLRAVRLDELPQLYDVLRGHMSLIGPRPLLPADLASDCSVRQSVVPGLTGWAQIHGGKSVTAEEKNALDEWYVYHASFALDLRIIWATLRIIVRGDARQDDAIAVAMTFREERLKKDTRLAASAPPTESIDAEVRGQKSEVTASGAGQIVEFKTRLQGRPWARQIR